MADYHGHVGIPKCLQLEFSIKEQICVLNLEQNKVYSANCDTAGTENHYYDPDVEILLSNKVETGLSSLIKELRKCRTNFEFTNCLNAHRDVLEAFFKFQLQRSKKMLNGINNESVSANTIGKYTHSDLLRIIDNINANILNTLGDKLFALKIECSGNQYLITNSLGFYPIVDRGVFKYFIIPLSNKDAICVQNGIDKENPYSHYIFDNEINDYFNKSCFVFEHALGNGYIYSKERYEMEDFLSKQKLKPLIAWNH